MVVVRLLEYLHEVPDHETGKLFLKTVSESFSIEETRLLALQSMVDQPVLGDHDETELFELNASFGSPIWRQNGRVALGRGQPVLASGCR